MREIPNALEILLDECAKLSASVPQELIVRVFEIEERVQFDEARRDAPQKIRSALKMILDKEFLEDYGNGNTL